MSFLERLQKLNLDYARLGEAGVNPGSFCRELVNALAVEAQRRAAWEEKVERELRSLSAGVYPCL